MFLKKCQKNENCPINVKCLPLGYVQALKCLPLGYVQAFYIDWAVLKLPKKCCIYFYIDWAVLKYCPINVKCLPIKNNYLFSLCSLFPMTYFDQISPNLWPK